MSEELTNINHITEEHNTIREHVKLVGGSMTDLEAIFSLQKAGAGWSLSSLKELKDNRIKLLQTLSALDEGLKNHFKMEETAMPSLIGENLMLALILDHKEIGKMIDKAKSLVADTRFEEMDQEESLKKKAEIQALVTDILWKAQDHALREETLMKMVKKALESKKT